MKQTSGSVKICAALLAAALLWRMIGAPLTAEDFVNLQTPFWQARILLPQRLERTLSLWMIAAQPAKAESYSGNEEKVLVYLNQEDHTVQMALEDYVQGVVAAEMPAKYHLEALKAQAVAARTRVMWQKQQGGCSLHPGADICTDSAHCQGFATRIECLERWKENDEAYHSRIASAQKETRGQWIAYEDKPITVLYHANSGGRTEDAQTVFAKQLPYLVSVESSEDTSADGYMQETFFSFEDLSAKLNCSAQEIQRTFAIGGYTASGRVSHIQVAGREIEATELRKLLGLRSTLFSITADEKGVVFHQRGYGHGVGMSQSGAQQMAANGADHIQILQHYYPGVQIVFPE